MWGVILLASLSINGDVATYARMPDDVYSGWYDTYAQCNEAEKDYNDDARRRWPRRIFGCMQKPAGSGLDGRAE
jgi:hypothetical protein